MNVFNRVGMSLILLVFIVFAVVTSILPRTVIQWLRTALDVAEFNLQPATQLALAAVGLLLAAGAILLLIAELRPRARQSVVVAQMAGGSAEIANDSVALRVRRVAESVAGVREATPVIRSRGKAVDIVIRLVTGMDVDIPLKTEEVMNAVRNETETRMGIPVRNLRVTVKHSAKDNSSPPPVASPAPRVPPAS